MFVGVGKSVLRRELEGWRAGKGEKREGLRPVLLYENQRFLRVSCYCLVATGIADRRLVGRGEGRMPYAGRGAFSPLSLP